MGIPLRITTPSTASPASKRCVYLERGFCAVCDCGRCGDNGILIDQWRAALKQNPAAPVPECRCVLHARNRKRLRGAGLETLVQRCTFESYRTDTAWQQTVKGKALDYLGERRDKSFFIAGQSGSGKTHICTAIAVEIMKSGRQLRYFQWVRDAARLKQLVNDPGYDTEIRRWTDVPYLYVDDLFKAEISDADIRLFYEILNARYNKGLPTIISSERSLDQIKRARGGAGEAIAGRIFEMCGGGRYCLELFGADKNYRFHRGARGGQAGQTDSF